MLDDLNQKLKQSNNGYEMPEPSSLVAPVDDEWSEFMGLSDPHRVEELGREAIEQRRTVQFPDDEGFVFSTSYCVAGLIPHKGVGLIAGQSRAGKTFIAVELAAALATGRSFFGHKVSTRRPVLYIASEGHSSLGLRLEAVRQHRYLDVHKKDFHVALAQIQGHTDIDGVIEQIDTLRRNAINAFIAERPGNGLINVVFLDTLLSDFHVEEDNQMAATQVMTRLSSYAEPRNLLIVLNAHYGKSEAAGVRGASAWTASADFILGVSARTNEITGSVTNRKLALTKSRDGTSGPITGFELQETTIGVDNYGDPLTSAVVVELPSRQSAGASDQELFLEALVAASVTNPVADVHGFVGVPRSTIVEKLRKKLDYLDGRTFNQRLRRAQHKLTEAGGIMCQLTPSGKKRDMLVGLPRASGKRLKS